MKILVVSDEESSYIWDYFDPTPFRGVALILSCGDLAREYLQFLVTMIPAPLFYVPGNHDKGFVAHPPEGCFSLDGRAVNYRGLRLAGLGGCKSARKDRFEYSEDVMQKKVRALSWQIRRQGGLDIFVSHTSAYGYGDGKDPFHQGFVCFLPLLDRFAPQFHVFGHQHKRYGGVSSIPCFQSTQLINACGYRFIDCNSPDKKTQRR